MLLLAAAAPDSEPGRSSMAVPATLPGAEVLTTEQTAALVKRPGVVIVDVAEAPRRPDGLPPGALWLPPVHRDIPGSIWIPGAGRETLSPDLAQYYRAHLADLTGSSADRPILVYCHPNCRGSRNAAKRALDFGYRNVFWYPGGIEAWQDAGLPTAPAVPAGPGAAPMRGTIDRSGTE